MTDEVTCDICGGGHWEDDHQRVTGEKRERVSCDDRCGAFEEPETLDEYKVTLEHWQSHGLLSGCAHAR